MGLRINTDEQGGFALIEVLVAAALLLIGVAGILDLVDATASTTQKTRSREAGTTLQRELVEAARSVLYEQLTPGGVAALVSARPGLADSALGTPGWTINRRDTPYTVSVGVCSVDDPRDGTGAHDAGSFCAGPSAPVEAGCTAVLDAAAAALVAGSSVAGSAGVGSCGIDADLDGTVDGLAAASATLCVHGACSVPPDETPADYKRVVSLVLWPGGWNLQSTAVNATGSAAAPAVVALAPAVSTVTSGTALGLTAEVRPAATTLSLTLEGQPVAVGTSTGPTTWAATWQLGPLSDQDGAQPARGETLDGDHLLAAKAFDRYGQFGATRAVTVRVNRRRAFAPARVQAGRNGSAVEIEWSPGKERDLEGHRVYRATTLGGRVEVCAAAVRTRCRDEGPPNLPELFYHVVGLDRDALGALREGDRSASATVRQTNAPPPSPTGLQAMPSAAGPVLSWTAATAPDPDVGDAVDHYNVYRDGTGIVDRVDRTDVTETTWTDTGAGGLQHTYWITAVDRNLAESPLLGPVTL